MITLSTGRAVTELDYNTAITLEARKRGVSDGTFVAVTDWREREEIVTAYLDGKRRKQKRIRCQCAGCVYNVWYNGSANQQICSFHQTGRVRRKDQDGNCLEHTSKRPRRRNLPRKEKPTSRAKRGFGNQKGSVIWRLTHEDFSNQTIKEIAPRWGLPNTMFEIPSARSNTKPVALFRTEKGNEKIEHVYRKRRVYTHYKQDGILTGRRLRKG